MFRTLVMFPATADPDQVDDVVERTAVAFRSSAGFRSVTVSVGALMGPGAKGGQYARLLEADFDDVGDLLAALDAESFQETRAATEALSPTLLLYELREL